MDVISSTVHYWLVHHPTITNFEWKRGETLASTPLFLASTVFSYLFLTYTLSRAAPHRRPLATKVLKSITIVHNIVLLTLSLIMAVGCALSLLHIAPNLDYVICFPKDTKRNGPLFFWGYVFYISKIVEYMDTVLIIVSNSIKRLTFLHVYHHSTVVIMCYVCVNTAQSSFPMVIITNTSVHLIMYTYYLSCAIGVRPKWKRMVTDCQILQFMSSFVMMGLIFYYHFTGLGCSGIWSWCFNAVFVGSLLVLFVDFHCKAYSKEKKMKDF